MQEPQSATACTIASHSAARSSNTSGGVGTPYDEYRQYTWHTNRDTYDKIVFDDLAENATLAAMLAYMASEDPERTKPI